MNIFDIGLHAVNKQEAIKIATKQILVGFRDM